MEDDGKPSIGKFANVYMDGKSGTVIVQWLFSRQSAILASRAPPHAHGGKVLNSRVRIKALK